MTPFRETNRITSPYGWRTYTNAAGKTIRTDRTWEWGWYKYGFRR